MNKAMIRERLEDCRDCITKTAIASGRLPGDILLVAVTKGVEPAFIYEAIDGGVGDIGENRVQEALLKYELVNQYAERKGLRVNWHMTGHLQSNKVKDAVRIFDIIHSVDSLRIAQEIDRQARGISKIQDVLLEVKTSSDDAKFGFSPDGLPALIKEILSLKNIRVRGLMTIASMVKDSEDARIYFRSLRDLRDELNHIAKICLADLSMGMTDDFKIAIEEGATMIRIGRGIFGDRKL